MRHLWTWAIGLALLGSAIRPPEARGQGPGPIELHDGDRVVLVGGTFIEREAELGYLETQFARRYPGRRILVRNLGWSGDTVTGESRAVGNPVQDGFKQLVGHVVALKPTVVVLGYGANEAFDGEAGLPGFANNFAKLWDALATTGARFVVLLPPRQANLGPPLPDPAAHNGAIKLYSAALRAEAERRGAVVVDLFDLVPERQPDPVNPPGAIIGPRLYEPDLTTNGLHLNQRGYWTASQRIAPGFSGPAAPPLSIPTVDAAALTAPPSSIAAIDEIARTATGVRFRLTFRFLPESSPIEAGDHFVNAGLDELLCVTGLPPGRYAVNIDGRKVPPDRTAEELAGGQPVLAIPDIDQVEALRHRIIAKNRMYFHRWRPQNETYLFGFRKYEQGRNAAELAAFDPLIAAEEAEIARLSRPAPHVYELTRTGDAAPAANPRTGEVPR